MEICFPFVKIQRQIKRVYFQFVKHTRKDSGIADNNAN